MNVTIFANQVIFPCLLFCFFSYFLIIRPEIQSTSANIMGADIQDHQNSLDDIYELIAQDDYWQSELDDISDRQQLIDKLIVIAASNGLYLTPSDIDRSIEQHTEKSQNRYVCLPIGCWRVG